MLQLSVNRDGGRKITQPLMLLWGMKGTVQRCFDVLAQWQGVATNVQGQALPCGHYIAEEAPVMLLAQVLPFLNATMQN